MKTILKFSVELQELVGRKWQMAPNRMFQQLTDKTKKKKKHRPFYEAVDAHARRRLKRLILPSRQLKLRLVDLSIFYNLAPSHVRTVVVSGSYGRMPVSIKRVLCIRHLGCLVLYTSYTSWCQKWDGAPETA